MSLASLVAFAFLLVLIAWLALVLGATWRTMVKESREAGLVAPERPRAASTDGGPLPASESRDWRGRM